MAGRVGLWPNTLTACPGGASYRDTPGKSVPGLVRVRFAALSLGAFEPGPFTSREQEESDAQGKGDDAQEHLAAGKCDTGTDAQRAEDEPEVSSVHGGFFGVLGAFRECVVRSVDLV